MKAIISSTYDDLYLWNLPLITWAWNRLGVDVICFIPYLETDIENKKIDLINSTFGRISIKPRYAAFMSEKHKRCTYAQCSRLYGACLDLPEDEVLVTGDIDMAVFKKIFVDIPKEFPHFYVIGNDLTPDKQYPICYAYARVGTWRSVFKLDGKTYQQCLDEHLGDIECENMRGNYWGADQEKLYNMASMSMPILIPRSNGKNQFAQNRVDRDDTNWRIYLNDNLIDAHLWRPGYTDENFAKIMELMTTMYPSDDFSWLVEYNEKYKQLL